jgi:hypothetical protein
MNIFNRPAQRYVKNTKNDPEECGKIHSELERSKTFIVGGGGGREGGAVPKVKL